MPQLVGVFIRILSITVLGALVLGTLGDKFFCPLDYSSERVISLEVPLDDRSFIADLLSRAPIAALSIIPERLQVKLGMAAFVSPFTKGLPEASVDRISGSVGGLYQDISRDTVWNRVPSVTGYAAVDLLGIVPQRAHAYIYVPKSSNGNPKKALVFFHGSLGNLLAYPYLWSRYAEQTGSLIICPSFGFGRWGEKDVLTPIIRSLPSNLQVPISDTVIVGLSAGGYGVMRALQRHADYRAAIFISAVLPDVSELDHKMAQWQSRPFIFFHGADDHVVPESYARKKVEEYRDFGAKIHIFPGESHFLLMSQADKLFEQLRGALGY